MDIRNFIEEHVADFHQEFANAGGDYDGSLEPLKDHLRSSLHALLAEIEKKIKDVRGDDELWDDYTYLKILNILRPPEPKGEERPRMRLAAFCPRGEKCPDPENCNYQSHPIPPLKD